MSFQEKSKEGVNPEKLFALGYAACFNSALDLMAKQMKLDISEAKTSVGVSLGMKPDGSYNLDIDISIQVSGVSEDDAQKLIKKAHEVCPYSNATRGNVEVRLNVTVV